MADAITIKALQDASLDAKSLEDVVNGDEDKQVTTRLGETYPSVKKAIKQMFENGGLPATPFKTKALMEASELVDGDYAQVTDDTVNNGLYIKTSGSWVESEYDPLRKAKEYVDNAQTDIASGFSELDKLISSQDAEPLLIFKDSEGSEYALFNSAGELILAGLDSSVQSSLQQEAQKTADLIEKTDGLLAITSGFGELGELISSQDAEPLLSFKDSEGTDYALFNSAGELMLSGLDSSVQSSLREVEKTADLIEKTAGLLDNDFGELALTHEFKDSEGYTVLALDSNGSLLLQGLGGKGLQQCIYELQQDNQDNQDSQDRQDEVAGFTVIVEPEPITPIVTEPPRVRLDETHNTPQIQGVPSGARTGSRNWVCWYSNDLIKGEGGGDYVNVAYSDDNWDTSVEYAHIAYDDPTLRVFDPQIWTDPRGFLWVLVGVGGNNVISDGLQGTWAFTVKNPEAEIPNFSAAMLVSKIGIPMHPKTINEQTYLPIDNWLGTNSQFPELPASRIFALDYLDRKAQRIIDLPASPLATKYVETNIAQLSNGDIIGVVRTRGSAQITKSTDNGKTWSQFEPWLALGANPSTRLWIGATPSGRLLVAYNNAEDRTNLTIGLSEDGGETLSHKLLVDTRAGVTYPTVYFDNDGNIHVVYDRSRGVAKEINVAIVNEAELIAGTATPIIKIISTK